MFFLYVLTKIGQDGVGLDDVDDPKSLTDARKETSGHALKCVQQVWRTSI